MNSSSANFLDALGASQALSAQMKHELDTHGDTVVNGVSWDLLPVAFWAGVAVIVGHLVWRMVAGRNGRKGGG